MSSRPREEIPPEADEVLPYLFVGNLVFARNPALVANLGITHILNLTRHSVPKELYEQCHYTAIVLKDKSGQDIISHFGTAFEAIESAKRARGKIFVHCKAGVSRSVTITVAYLMHAYKWTLRESWFHVRKARSVIHPNRGFLHQLVQYEKTLFPSLKGSQYLPSLNLREEIHFTVFERMEELYGAPLMDFCKANPECQHEIEELAAKAYHTFHSKINSSFCYDAGIAGKMHLHRVQLYTRADLPWLDACIQGYIALLEAKQTLQPAQIQQQPPHEHRSSKHHHSHHHHHHSNHSNHSNHSHSSHHSNGSNDSSHGHHHHHHHHHSSSSSHKHHHSKEKEQQQPPLTEQQQQQQQHSSHHSHHRHHHHKADAEHQPTIHTPHSTTQQTEQPRHQQQQQQEHLPQQQQHHHQQHQQHHEEQLHRQPPEVPVIPTIPPDSPLA